MGSIIEPSTMFPADVWVLLAQRLLHTDDRNGILALSCVNKDLNSTLLGSSSLWKDVVFSYFFRLFSKTSPAFFASFTAQHWRRLLRCLLACRTTAIPIKLDAESYKPGPFALMPAWMKDDYREGWIREDKPPSDDLKYGPCKFNHSAWVELLKMVDNDTEEEFLLHNGDVIYKFGFDINTAEFWFSHLKAEDGTPLHIRIGDLLNADVCGAFSALSNESLSLLDDEELLRSFANLIPHKVGHDMAVEPVLEVVASLVPVVPEFIPASAQDIIAVESLIPEEWSNIRPRNISIYRYAMPRHSLPFTEFDANDVIHIMLPLQDPDTIGFNEERIKHYQDQMQAGAFPTVAAFCRTSHKYRIARRGLPITSQQVIVSVILDGHHKLEAAARLNCPVGLLMFGSYERDHQTLAALHSPVPSWPFNERERNKYLPREAPFTLLYDNLEAPVPKDTVDSFKKAVSKAVSCGDSIGCVKRIIVPSSLDAWQHTLIHGGLIEFDSLDSLIRALVHAQGRDVNGNTIALQIPTLLSSHDNNFIYDLSTDDGVVYYRDPSDTDSGPEQEVESNNDESDQAVQNDILRLLAGGADSD